MIQWVSVGGSEGEVRVNLTANGVDFSKKKNGIFNFGELSSRTLHMYM